jgi:hypothetical protein
MPIDERDDDLERLQPVVRAPRAADASAADEEGPLEGGLRPRSTGELLDLAVELLRRRFGALVGLSVILILPARLSQPFLGMHRWIDGLESGSPDVVLVMLGIASVMALPALAQMLARAAVCPIVWGELTGERASAGEAFRRALVLFLPVFVVTLLAGLLTTAGMCAFFVGALFVAWKLACAIPALVIERNGIAQALQRSFELTGGGFLRYVVLGVVMMIVVTPLNGLPGFAADHNNMRPIVIGWLGVSETVFDIMAVPVTALLLGLGVAIASTLTVVYYADCRVRRDGTDLRRRLDVLAARHPSLAQPGFAPQRFNTETW